METDYAWAAGFLEGEGSFLIYKNGKYWHTALEASQVALEPLYRLRDLFAGSVYPSNAGSGRASKWRIDGSYVGEPASKVAPYLTFKRPQALLLVEFAATISSSHRRLSDEVLATRERLAAEMAALRS